MNDNIHSYKIYRNVTIRDSKIGADTIIGDDSFVTNSFIGSHCLIDRRNMIFDSEIGNYSYSAFNTVIRHANIGKYCSISWNVGIGGVNHEMNKLSMHPFPFDPFYGFVDDFSDYPSYYNEKLVIGNDVWIGSNVSILRGVSIGDGAIIGAGGVVTHDVPPYEIWVGVPAKKVSQRFSDEIISKLLKLKWWEFSHEKIIEMMPYFKQQLTMKIIDELYNKYN